MKTHDDNPTQDAAHCAPQQLASSEIGSIDACFECGTVRLNFRTVSLRLEPEAFRELALMVGAAHIRLQHHAESVIAAATAGAKPH